MTLLSVQHLAPLAAAHIAVPGYDRRQLGRGIVHLGLGAFARAHVALYTEAAVAGGDMRWGITGVSLRDAGVPTILAAQDQLYSVTEQQGAQAGTRVVGVLGAAWHAPTQLPRVLAAIANLHTAVVTLTVTEKGYSRHAATGDLDLADADVQHDLAHPHSPRSTLGVLAAGLALRPAGAPITLLSCDNMAGNGAALQRVLVQFVQQTNAALAQRIEADIAMPNSMVDRIVPAATPESLAYAQQRLGLRDEAAIVCEPFTQWVIEDRFSGPRPAWEAAGALLTSDVKPYQEMKLRLLNGTHSAIAYAGQLRGLATVAQVMADPLVGGFVRRLMLEDLRACVQAPAGFDVAAYCAALLQRFENTALAHRTEQIAMDGTQKVPVRWLPTLRESLAQGVERPLLERALAMWLHCVQTQRNDERVALVSNDPGAAALQARMGRGGTALASVEAALAYAAVFGHAAWPPALVLRLAGHVQTLRSGGARGLLALP